MIDHWSGTDYYRRNARRYSQDTLNLDMTPLYERFLGHLSTGARILDAGCGSGRDSRAFIERGYAVRACDASPELAAMAEAYAGIPVDVLRFQDFEYVSEFHGIWACASLLHVSLEELPDVYNRLARALESGGVVYASFKYGTGSREEDGRRFTDLDEATLAMLFAESGGLQVRESWVTPDRRPDRQSDRWLNALLGIAEGACQKA